MPLLDTRILTGAHLYVRYRDREVIWKLRIEPNPDLPGWYAMMWSPGDKYYFQKLAPTKYTLWVRSCYTVTEGIEKATAELKHIGREVVWHEQLVDDTKVEVFVGREG